MSMGTTHNQPSAVFDPHRMGSTANASATAETTSGASGGSTRRISTPLKRFPAVRSTVEAEPGRVQQLQPRTSLALPAVGSGERTARQPDPRVAERLRRERPGFGANHPQAGPLGVTPVHEVERGPRSPPRGANAEARVTRGVRDLASQPGAEEHGEAAARVDGTGPCVGEPYALD